MKAAFSRDLRIIYNVSGLSGLLSQAQTPILHSTSHKHGGTDEVGSSIAVANGIPKASVGAALSAGWGGAALSLATLDAVAHVVEPVTVFYDGVGTDLPIVNIAENGLLYRSSNSINSLDASNFVVNGSTAGGDLSGTYLNPLVTGLRNKPVPVPVASGYLQYSTGNNRWVFNTYGTGLDTICQGNDSRLSNSRAPTAHASGHNSTGNDPLFQKDIAKFQVEYYLRDDFGTLTNWATSSANGGVSYNTESQFQTLIDRNHVGVARVDQGATSGGYTHLYLNNLTYCLLGSGHQLEFLFTISNTGYRGTGRLGFGDGTGHNDHTDGAYIEIDYSTSINYRLCTASGGVRTKTTSTVAATTNVWHTGLIDFYSPTGVRYFVDGAFLGSQSGTLPTGLGRDTTIQFYTIGNVANGFFRIDVDAVEHRCLVAR